MLSTKQQKRKKISRSTFRYFILPLAVIWIVVIAIPRNRPIIQRVFDPPEPSAKSTAIPESKNWNYIIERSMLPSSPIVRHAENESLNKVNIRYPYHGGSTLSINIRQGFHKKGNEVYLTIDNGRFLAKKYGKRAVKIRFDNRPTEKFSYKSIPDSGSTNSISIEDQKGFLSELKNANEVIIEADFFNNIPGQFHFDTEGLIWD